MYSKVKTKMERNEQPKGVRRLVSFSVASRVTSVNFAPSPWQY
jgi:hypothetical protein